MNRFIPWFTFGMLLALSKCEQPAQREWKNEVEIFIAVAIVLLTPALAFAGSKNSASFELDEPVTVAGTQLAPGHYKLSWDGSGPDLKVSFAEGKKTVATVSAKLVRNSNSEEAIETISAADNTKVLQAIDVKNITLQFSKDAPAAGN